ncbi:MAG: hypothetical protein NTU74_01730 [Deltaproteobacteria bacterium]|nr:hypothetical protein [Deltaproteobacteria bacterium]
MKMNRLSVSANLAVLLSLSLLFTIQTDAASYPESAFHSLYQDPRSFPYTDTSGNQQTQTRYGYRYQNDLTDSIVVCGKENDASCVTSIYNTTRYLNANRPNQYISSTLFKIFIPPGSSAYTLLAYVTQSTTAGISNRAFAVARFGRPPDADSGYVPSNYSALPSTGGSLSQMINNDYIVVNSQGYLQVVTDNSPNITAESQGRWLYVILKAVSGSIISYYSNNEIRVGTPNTPGTYLGWYTTYNWNTMGFPFGRNLCGEFVCKTICNADADNHSGHGM